MKHIFLPGLFMALAINSHALEILDRGAVALPAQDGKGIFVSWRSLTADGDSAAFDIYRDGVRINVLPVADVTSFTDSAGVAGAVYEIRPTAGYGPAGSCTAWDAPYFKIHLDRPADGVTGPRGEAQMPYSYSPDDMSIGDVDGDGQMELFVKWMPSNGKDSAHPGFTGPTIIDCYRMDGTRLWRVNLGHNIRSGQHYTQFMVYDFDGDGRAEMICKTAPGTIDGVGEAVLLPGDKVTDDYRMHVNEPRKILGHVRGGSEYLTCFDGLTGKAVSTIPYRPGYDYVPETLWGDDNCNRADRYLAGVAYLDGRHPSAIMCRGYYTCSFVWAVDFRDGKLQEVWLHESTEPGKGLWGEGAHSLTIGDVDGDGCDEIVMGSGCLDNDGSLLYRLTPEGLHGHGDALHMARMIPDRDGLQVFMVHESKDPRYPYDFEMRDARTGEVIYMKGQTGEDVGRGLAANVSAAYPGYEYWSTSDRNVYSQGKAIVKGTPSINFRIYWDGDLLDELFNGTRVTKPEAYFQTVNTLAAFDRIYPGAHSCNGSKSTPCLQADLLGDWREEIILYDGNTRGDIMIFTTNIPTSYKLPCLLQDRQYREAIAWQNTTYNQPPHLSYSPEDVYENRSAVLVTEGSSMQTIAEGSSIAPIKLQALRAERMALPTLPAGFSGEVNSDGTLKITGKPSETGVYRFNVTTTGADNGRDGEKTIEINVVTQEQYKKLQEESRRRFGPRGPRGDRQRMRQGDGRRMSRDGRPDNDPRRDDSRNNYRRM